MHRISAANMPYHLTVLNFTNSIQFYFAIDMHIQSHISDKTNIYQFGTIFNEISFTLLYDESANNLTFIRRLLTNGHLHD